MFRIILAKPNRRLPVVAIFVADAPRKNLHGLLGLPLGYVMKLLNKHSSTAGIGSIAKLYQSACTLDESLLYVRKEELINQKPSKPLPLLTGNLQTSAGVQFFYYYKCTHCNNFIKAHSPKSSYDNCHCRESFNGRTQRKFKEELTLVEEIPFCFRNSYIGHPYNGHAKFSEKLTLVEGTPDSTPAKKPGFVKKSSSFIISDDLTITPSSTIKSIDLLNSLNVHTMSDLMSMELAVGENEAVAIVKASLTSSTVLNDVFKSKIKSVR